VPHPIFIQHLGENADSIPLSTSNAISLIDLGYRSEMAIFSEGIANKGSENFGAM